MHQIRSSLFLKKNIRTTHVRGLPFIVSPLKKISNLQLSLPFDAVPNLSQKMQSDPHQTHALTIPICIEAIQIAPVP